MKNLTKSWKSTIIGGVMLVAFGFTVYKYLNNQIDSEQFNLVTGSLAVVGGGILGLVAKDGNASHSK